MLSSRFLGALCIAASVAGLVLASYPGPAAGRAIAKRAGSITVEADDGLYVVAAAGGQPRKIPGTLPGDGNAVWSPDGRHFSFERERNGNWDVWVMNADGSGQRQLTFSLRDDDFAEWSPKGRWLVFQSARHRTEAVYAINLRTGGARRVTQPGSFPYWRPDGRIIYVLDGDIYTVRPSGADSRPIANEPLGHVWAAAVSKDGRTLVYVTDAGIFAARSDGSQSRQLTDDPRDDDPVLSPDGGWVAFDRGSFVYVIRADGSEKTPSMLAIGCCPDWQ